MIRRGIEPFLGYWGPPGGVQEVGEPLEETARREVKEETGLDVEVIEELGRVKGPITGHYHSLFLCRPTAGNLRPSFLEATDAGWIPYEEIPRQLVLPFILDFLDALDLRRLERASE